VSKMWPITRKWLVAINTTPTTSIQFIQATTTHIHCKEQRLQAFDVIENGRSWLFLTKMGIVWPLAFNQRLL
jgi:predicted 3-demethylubiquinone-9 3-methyltransferase (glyoxalase superfamily)